uniref:Mucin-1 n=1 Tax=Strix occidentalis caurina TaxID=311401 RepID=A0A8D0FPI6_STROC
MITVLKILIHKNTNDNGIQTSVSSHTTVSPTTGNATNFQSSNSSAGNSTANSTAVPVSSSATSSPTNATTNGSNWVPPLGTNTTNSSSAAPTVGGGTVIPISSTKGNGSSSSQVAPTRKTSVTSQGSTAPRQTPTAVLGGSGSPKPSKAAALLPTDVQLLLRVPLSFRILNRSFNESLRDPTSKEYKSLSYTILSMVSPSPAHELPGRWGGDIASTSACGPGLGHCSAGPGLHPAATSCTCRRKSQGKLDLFSTKDSYHPMAEYPPYQSHGRYVSPNSKPNPYSQVRAKVNGAGAGTFTYTNSTPTSDNL